MAWKIPDPMSDAQYAQIVSDLAELRAALGSINVRISEVETMLQTPMSAQEYGDMHVSAALEFARTGNVHAVGGVSHLQEEHVKLRKMREALETSIRSKEIEQRDRMSTLSHEISRSLDGEQKKIVVRHLELLRAIDDVTQQQRKLLRAIEEKGYSAIFPCTATWFVLGDLQDITSTISQRVRDLEPYAK